MHRKSKRVGFIVLTPNRYIFIPNKVAPWMNEIARKTTYTLAEVLFEDIDPDKDLWWSKHPHTIKRVLANMDKQGYVKIPGGEQQVFRIKYRSESNSDYFKKNISLTPEEFIERGKPYMFSQTQTEKTIESLFK